MRESESSKVIMTHIMVDGSERKSLKGYQVSADRLPLTARRIIKDIITSGTKHVPG